MEIARLSKRVHSMESSYLRFVDVEERVIENGCKMLRDKRDSTASNLEWKIQQLESRVVNMTNQDKEIEMEYTPEYESSIRFL